MLQHDSAPPSSLPLAAGGASGKPLSLELQIKTISSRQMVLFADAGSAGVGRVGSIEAAS